MIWSRILSTCNWPHPDRPRLSDLFWILHFTQLEPLNSDFKSQPNHVQLQDYGDNDGVPDDSRALPCQRWGYENLTEYMRMSNPDNLIAMISPLPIKMVCG